MLDNILSVLIFIYRQKRIPNIFSPKSLTEKILKIKLSRNSKTSNLRKIISDRLGVRDYLKMKSQESILIDLLWKGSELEIETWLLLPQKFVIKATHGSKMVRIVDKNIDSFEEINSLSKGWLDIDYYKKGREWVYKDTERLLIIEKFIEFSGDVPPDYKFFCMNGVVSFVQVDLDRFNGHSRSIYDKNFKLLDVAYQFSKGYEIDKPVLFNNAKVIAEKLSEDFDFIRVDLYILDDQIYFGELTNFPGNCLESFTPHSFDIQMGSKLKLEL